VFESDVSPQLENEMKIIHDKERWLCIFMAILTVMVSMPCRPVSAALIDTESVAESIPGRAARDQVHQFFKRADVQEALIAHGLDPAEARSRIDALSDEEVIRVADRIDTLPAGGSSFLLVGAAILVVTIIVYAIILLAVEATE
jgi:hypothetical protein